MTLSYESSLDDVVESAVRLFLRSKTYRTNKWRGALICAVVFAGFAFLGFHSRGTIGVAWICAAAAVWGAVIFLLTYKGSVRRRIKKYVADETKGQPPHKIDYSLTNDALVRTQAGRDTTFPLSDLAAIVEDAGRLELSFGEKGLCVIPLRAFRSDDEKTAFLSAVRSSTTIS